MPTSAKLFRTFELLARFGNALGMPQSRHLGGGLFELRVRGVQEVRFFYTFHRGRAILLHGFIKKSARIPQREMDFARRKLSVLDEI